MQRLQENCQRRWESAKALRWKREEEVKTPPVRRMHTSRITQSSINEMRRNPRREMSNGAERSRAGLSKNIFLVRNITCVRVDGIQYNKLI